MMPLYKIHSSAIQAGVCNPYRLKAREVEIDGEPRTVELPVQTFNPSEAARFVAEYIQRRGVNEVRNTLEGMYFLTRDATYRLYQVQ